MAVQKNKILSLFMAFFVCNVQSVNASFLKTLIHRGMPAIPGIHNGLEQIAIGLHDLGSGVGHGTGAMITDSIQGAAIMISDTAGNGGVNGIKHGPWNNQNSLPSTGNNGPSNGPSTGPSNGPSTGQQPQNLNNGYNGQSSQYPNNGQYYGQPAQYSAPFQYQPIQYPYNNIQPTPYYNNQLPYYNSQIPPYYNIPPRQNYNSQPAQSYMGAPQPTNNVQVSPDPSKIQPSPPTNDVKTS